MEAQRKLVTDHLNHCPACRQLAGQYANLKQRVSTAPAPQAPAGFYLSFDHEVLQQLSAKSISRWKSASRRSWRFKLLFASGGLILFLIFSLFVWRISLLPSRTTLTTYLSRTDLSGLNTVLTDPQTRRNLMSDSVSVDLLVTSLQRLSRSPVYRDQITKSISIWLTIFRNQRGDLKTASDHQTRVSSVNNENRLPINLDLEQVIKLLKVVRRYRSRVTLNELISWQETYLKI